VLVGLWLRRVFGIGPYRELSRRHPVNETPTGDVAPVRQTLD
jgi:hypothetical protein